MTPFKYKIFLVVIFSILSTITLAQTTFKTEFNKGIELYNKGEYYEAYLRFNGAKTIAEVKEKNFSNAKKAQGWIGKAVIGIKMEKERSDSLLKLSQEMQLKMETSVFDKAIKGKYKNWKGLNNYDRKVLQEIAKKNKILDKIDTLDLSFNFLIQLPKEVSLCKNLKSINLIGNSDLDFDDCFSKLSKLKNLGDIKISVYNLDDVPLKYWNMITGVELLTKGLTKIPQNVINQSQLTYLDISGEIDNYNILDTLKGIESLKNLKHLNLEFCKLKNLAKIGQLRKLETLNVGYNSLSSLPDGFKELINLKTLKLHFNKFKGFPKEICNLINLTHLNISYNNITILPTELEKLKYLEELLLNENKINKIPQNIYKLENLRHLNLWKNNLDSLPQEITKLSSLEYLDLYGNNLKAIPGEIGHLQKLKFFNIADNYLKNIPNGICYMLELNSLDLGNSDFNHNKVVELPSEIGNLKKLTHLNIRGNELINLPESFTKLQNLQYLNIEGNMFTSIPTEIFHLKSLSDLKIQANPIISVPQEIKKQINFNIDFSEKDFELLCNPYTRKELTFYFYRLKNIPNDVFELVNLKKLNLSNNEIKSIPSEIAKLKRLEEINFNKNRIATIPDELWNLNNIKVLAIGDNMINQIEGVQKLINLEEIYIWGNNIQEIPIEVGRLKNLRILYLGDLILNKEQFAHFLKICNKPIQLTKNEDKYRNLNNNNLRILVDNIAPEWIKIPNVTLIDN